MSQYTAVAKVFEPSFVLVEKTVIAVFVLLVFGVLSRYICVQYLTLLGSLPQVTFALIAVVPGIALWLELR